MIMKHDDAQEMLQEFFDGELDTARADAIRTHITECAHCRGVLESWTVLRNAVRESADADCSPMFASELRESVLSEQDALGAWSAIELLARRTVAGLAVAVCLLTAFLWTESEDLQRSPTTALTIVAADSTSAGLLLQSQELTKSDVLYATLAD
jgi:anti-sigma factor RsiW